MPLISMTGFGKSEGSLLGTEISVEVKSVNGRHLEVSMRMPRDIQSFEYKFKQVVQQYLQRGSINLNINFGSSQENQAIPNGVNMSFLKKYVELSQQIQKDFPEITGNLDINRVLTHPEVLNSDKTTINWDEHLNELCEIIGAALKNLIQMRSEEGLNLEKDIHARIEQISSWLDQIEVLLPTRLKDYQDRLHERINQLIVDFGQVDPMRLHQEVAYMADRMDITEEIVRFRSHNEIFVKTLKQAGPHGKRLNFLLQEMGREANTLTTKSHFVEIQHLAVSIKEELETLREQIANIE